MSGAQHIPQSEIDRIKASVPGIATPGHDAYIREMIAFVKRANPVCHKCYNKDTSALRLCESCALEYYCANKPECVTFHATQRCLKK